ncbi:hypothetical protein CY35_13G050600 [Sphagnum magellanicum]|nr:hypothetical protein CY35_13G050600 [Sphagnum magellanicum]
MPRLETWTRRLGQGVEVCGVLIVLVAKQSILHDLVVVHELQCSNDVCFTFCPHIQYVY